MSRFLLLLIPFLATSVGAQSFTEGFTLGGSLHATALSVDDSFDDETNNGGGLTVEAGYGVSRVVTLFLALSGSSLKTDQGDEYGLGLVDLGARAHLLPGGTLNPYVQAALSGQAAVFDVSGTSENVELRGGGLLVGGGVLYQLSRSIALDVSLDLTGGRFTEIEFDGESTDDFDEVNSGTARLGVGIVASL